MAVKLVNADRPKSPADLLAKEILKRNAVRLQGSSRNLLEVSDSGLRPRCCLVDEVCRKGLHVHVARRLAGLERALELAAPLGPLPRQPRLPGETPPGHLQNFSSRSRRKVWMPAQLLQRIVALTVRAGVHEVVVHDESHLQQRLLEETLPPQHALLHLARDLSLFVRFWAGESRRPDGLAAPPGSLDERGKRGGRRLLVLADLLGVHQTPVGHPAGHRLPLELLRLQRVLPWRPR
mmetsp:Transcript_5621/g.16936  ORF Transcript_5621/g.16936 Transcript_5621/m.16936 type:complete len:236 (-) Transcript_5621:883-1590(-)